MAAVRGAIKRRLAEVKMLTVDVETPIQSANYTPEEIALAGKAARLRGEPSAPMTGRPWVDFAGHLADLPDEDWEAYEAAVRAAREEGNAQETHR